MRGGDTVAGRFVVQREAGVGGMGRVYRAEDQTSGRPVALKMLSATDEASRERFDREARILSELSHPVIVGYVAHGKDASGTPFLAMEWLEGVPLSVRLRSGPLSPSDTASLGLHVAEALAAAHAAGVLHRDVKPSNLILGRGDADVSVVDFGVARHVNESDTVTRTGLIVGSCAYMSPEQARGARHIGTRSDLFSLGCVLYECVSGIRAFGASDATASLAKVLLDEPAPLQEVAPAVSPAFASLVTKLLRKNPDERPESAHEVAKVLRDIVDGRVEGPSSEPVARSLGRREQRVVWVVLASNANTSTTMTQLQADDSATLVDDAGTTAQLRGVVRSFGGTLAFLANATAIATFSGGVPTDEAGRAAQCALAMREVLHTSAIALAMGRGELGMWAPIGAVIDDAADALRRTAMGAIRLRGVEAEWLVAFDVAHDEDGLVLAGRKEAVLTPRTLLGRPTSCVGRERELAMLEGLFDDTSSESQARVTLVTAAAGIGKSRIRHELIARLEARDEPPMVLVGRCDPMSAGAPFAVIGDAIRRHAGILEGDDDVTRRARIEACVVPTSEASFDSKTHAMLLGELAGVRFSALPNETLRAARQDARLMGDLLRTAFEEWILASPHPVVFVIEDLHWGDVSSVRLIDAVLRNLGSRPLFVVAFARPEVAELFPSLWIDRGVVSIALSPLSKRAAEKLVHEALGDMPGLAVSSLVERAQGNAFFLEELVRGAARGDAALPDSIFGVLQARLDALDGDARRVLRAASVFGDGFTTEGVVALLGDTLRHGAVTAHLDALARAEIVTKGEARTFRFRHALVRDATYATLTEDDRKLGHRLAAAALETTAGVSELALAEHYVRGGAAEYAIAHLRTAATKALEGNDIRGAVTFAERALALSTERADRGVLHATCCEAYRWLGEYDRAKEHGLASIDALEEGSVGWFLAVGEYIAACAYGRDSKSAAPQLARARAVRAGSREARNAQIVCIARGCTQHLDSEYFDATETIIQELKNESDSDLDDKARGWIHWLYAMRVLRDGDLAAFVRSTTQAMTSFEQLGDVRNATSQRTNLGYAYAELGAFELAEPLLRRVHRDAERMGLPMICAYALQNLGSVLRAVGRVEEGRIEVGRAIVIGEAIRDLRIEGAARVYAALMTLELGDAAVAETEARRAIRELANKPALLGIAKAVLARSLHVQGRLEEAAASSTEAMTLVGDGVEDGETFIRLVHIEILEAAGDLAGARDAAFEAERRLRARAGRIQDASLRDSFLQRVPDSARTLAAAARLR
jgi:eukaryotic-like serine/threonine-protein kinase